MATQPPVAHEARLQARNIGGIDETTVELGSGITVLAGRNATNRTSLLQAFMAALGGDAVSLKADAEEGVAELEIGEESYRRTLRRTDGGVVMGGEPYLEDPELAELFAFLLELNPARQAVTTQDDLRELIFRPIDTDEIDAKITQLTAEKDQLTEKLDRLESVRRQLPALEQTRTDLEGRIEEKRAELETVTAAIEAVESGNERDELDEKLTKLRESRSRLDDLRFEVETERESLEALRDERKEIQAELDTVAAPESVDEAAIDAEVDRLQRRSQSIDSVLTQLRSIIQFNEEMLEGAHPEIRDVLADDHDGESETVTDRLFEADDTVRCWTCGSTVDRADIESTIEQLRSHQETKLAERDDLKAQIQSLRSDRRELDQRRKRHDRLEERLESTAAEIDRRESRLEELLTRREELEADIERLERDASALEAESEPEETNDESLLELNRQANDLEFSLGRLERDLETTLEEIAEIESALETESQLSNRLEELRDELEALRTRIDRLERQAVESFNEHMDAVLDVLEYDNIERIWIERIGQTVREGRRTVEQAAFELHIVRSTDDGRTYEDTIEHLSESEREVTGLIFALAGYLVHEVYDVVPFVLLDSLEAVDSNRIAALVEYFESYTDFLVVALLPEDAAAIDERHERIPTI